MTEYERITQSPQALAAFLRELPVIEAPWDQAFQKQYCAGCAAEDCDACPNEAYRNNPAWWLAQAATEERGRSE